MTLNIVTDDLSQLVANSVMLNLHWRVSLFTTYDPAMKTSIMN